MAELILQDVGQRAKRVSQARQRAGQKDNDRTEEGSQDQRMAPLAVPGQEHDLDPCLIRPELERRPRKHIDDHARRHGRALPHGDSNGRLTLSSSAAHGSVRILYGRLCPIDQRSGAHLHLTPVKTNAVLLPQIGTQLDRAQANKDRVAGAVCTLNRCRQTLGDNLRIEPAGWGATRVGVNLQVGLGQKTSQAEIERIGHQAAYPGQEQDETALSRTLDDLWQKRGHGQCRGKMGDPFHSRISTMTPCSAH